MDAELHDCLIVSNTAVVGGGVQGGYLVNCTVVGNTAQLAGGVYGYYSGKSGDVCYLSNCIVYYNNGGDWNNFNGVYAIGKCCSTPFQYGDIITNEPSFVDLAGGDFRLRNDSVCLNAGANAVVTSEVDLDGKPRLSGGTVDLGAYEMQNPAPALRIVPAGGSLRVSWPAWAQGYQLQETSLSPTSGLSWSNSIQGANGTNAERWVLVPFEADGKLYRLRAQ